MDLKNKHIKITRSKKGVPALWESLSVFEDMVRSTVFVDASGMNKAPLLVNTREHGTRTSRKQSLVPIQIGDFIVKVFEDKIGIGVSIFEIVDISAYVNECEIKLVYRKQANDEIELEIPIHFNPPIQFSINKCKSKDFGMVFSSNKK